MRSFAGRDIISLKDFEHNEFMHIFEIADRLEPIARGRRNSDMLKEKILVTAFYQPSTRTRLAHETAMHRLGGHVNGFADAKMTRAGDFYQETIKDTVHMLEFYGDAIVMRHYQQGAPQEAARWSSIPIINGGDGWGEHPTQVLTDLYTVQREMGDVNGKSFLAIGDHRMRTMHSLGYALSQFDAEFVILAPPDEAPTDEFLAELDDKGTNYRIVEHVDHAIADADVIYVEPVIQANYATGRDERGGEVEHTPSAYQINRKVMDKAKRSAIVLHSLPRMDELLPEVDKLRQARYWEEAYNGVVMRMALISLVMGAWQ